MEAGAASKTEDENNELDAAAILLSLKTTPPSFPPHLHENLAPRTKSTKENEGHLGYIPMYDWTQAIPSLSYAGNTYNINLQMYNSPVRLVPVPFNSQNNNCLQEMSLAFVKFCQIHRDTIILQNQCTTTGAINDKLIQLWSQLSQEEQIVYSKVARTEMLLIQGKDISTVKPKTVKAEQWSGTSRKLADSRQQFPLQAIERYAPSLFRHPMFAYQPDPTEHGNTERNFKTHNGEAAPPANGIPADSHKLPQISELSRNTSKRCTYKELRKPHQIPQPKKSEDSSKSSKYQTSIKVTKQRSLSLSDKTVHKVIIRRAVSHEEVSTTNKPFARPTTPDNVLIRMRRHSMNDGILNSPLEKINPYFTKNYVKSPHKTRNPHPKTPTKVHPNNVLSPKRNLSVTSLDLDNTLKSPPKRSKNNYHIATDIFDFKSEPQPFQGKGDIPEQEYHDDHEPRKTDTYSYSLLKGASKTSSVNPCFSSRKSLARKFSFLPQLPTKCVNRLKQEYSRKAAHETADNSSDITWHTPLSGRQGSSIVTSQRKLQQELLKQEKLSPTKNTTRGLSRGHQHTEHPTSPDISTMPPPKAISKKKRQPSPTPTDVTMVTSSSMESLGSHSSSSSTDSKKLELLNDSVLISHAIAELEDAEMSKLKGSRRSHTSGSMGISDARYRHVYAFFREYGLNPPADRVHKFYTTHKDVFQCKSAALLTIREVRQKIIKLQLM